MKTSNRYIVNANRIHSLKDIELEKQRLRLEILKQEQDIHSGYRNIVQALTFRNLATNIVSDIATSSSLLSKAISIGKAVMSRRKKKKHDKLKADTDEPRS